MDIPSVPEGLRLAHEQAQLSCGNLSKISYYIGRDDCSDRAHSLYMQRNAERPDAYFCIPAAQVLEMGIEIEI